MDHLQHFSHEHPLIFNEEKDIEDEINRDHFCSICKLPILLSSCYSCSNTGCLYLLHEPCALLPETMSHPWFRSSDFRLLKEPPNDHSHCKKCRQSCENFTYVDTSDPNITFHPMCRVPIISQIKSKHKSHPLHPLVAVGKRTSAVCDACVEEQNGHFFMCHLCNFWIHVDCALLPRIVKCTGHDHHLTLTYSSCDAYQSNDSFQRALSCLICKREMFGSGAYSCAFCYGFVHLTCAIKDMEDVGTERDAGVIHLPDADQSWIIRYILERLPRRGSAFDLKLIHDHPLILYNDTENSSDGGGDELLCCNACIQPIYPPFYACCSQSASRCHFHLHQLCSALPSSIRLVEAYFKLRTRSKKSLCSLFYCSMCCLLGNGFSYYYDDESCLEFHITCVLIQTMIKHASHKQHLLHSSPGQRNTIKSCCFDRMPNTILFRCFDCDFVIDSSCALLPGKIKHKYDTHPLDLITTGIANFEDDNNLCEFCEERIDTRFWYYGCQECDNLFHVKCIPSVGSLSKVKFGSSIDVSCHPPHPLTFVRMLGFGSQRCGYCEEIVEGFVDEMAFHCSKCDYWMHFECAEECTGAEKLLPPRWF